MIMIDLFNKVFDSVNTKKFRVVLEKPAEEVKDCRDMSISEISLFLFNIDPKETLIKIIKTKE